MPFAPPKHAPRARLPQHRPPEEVERQRNAEKAAVYDAAWKRLRRAFIAQNPICSVDGCGSPTTDVDHVESVRAAPHRRLDWDNLRAFCHPCHSRRTARDQGGWRRRGDS